jgi:hypothetical protein
VLSSLPYSTCPLPSVLSIPIIVPDTFGGLVHYCTSCFCNRKHETEDIYNGTTATLTMSISAIKQGGWDAVTGTHFYSDHRDPLRLAIAATEPSHVPMITVWSDQSMAFLLIYSVGRVSTMTAGTLWYIASADTMGMSISEAILSSPQSPV